MRPIGMVTLVLVSVGIIGCAAVRQQKAATAAVDQLEFKNLRVLSPTITHDELIATMRGYARALGTRCEHCHVVTATEPRLQLDFVSDAKPEKSVARTMMLMTADMNQEYLRKVNKHGQTATCATCHRGHTVPEQWSPEAAAPSAGRP